jgi:hypothetical protein
VTGKSFFTVQAIYLRGNIACFTNVFLQRRCKLFVYGGCKGNQNNFLSELECVRRCGDEIAIAELPPDIPHVHPPEIGKKCPQFCHDIRTKLFFYEAKWL